MNYEEKYLSIIKNIVLCHIDRREHLVFLFGSRARGTGRTVSDVDIGILGRKPIGKIYHKIVNEIERSIVPYRVDIIDFSLVAPEFKAIARQGAIIWNQPQDTN